MSQGRVNHFTEHEKGQVSLCTPQNVLPGWYDLDELMHTTSVLLSIQGVQDVLTTASHQQNCTSCSANLNTDVSA